MDIFLWWVPGYTDQPLRPQVLTSLYLKEAGISKTRNRQKLQLRKSLYKPANFHLDSHLFVVLRILTLCRISELKRCSKKVSKNNWWWWQILKYLAHKTPKKENGQGSSFP